MAGFLPGEQNIAKREDIRKKISEAKKGKSTWNKGKHLTEEWKRKIGLANSGLRTSKIRSCTTCKEKFTVLLSVLKRGEGKFCSRPCFNKFYRGKNHFRWISDRNKLVKGQYRNDSAYKDWMKTVKKRDENICQIQNEQCLGYHIVHHIQSWVSNPELRYQINNGITLCQFHHPLKRAEEQRLMPVFQELVGSK